MRAKTGVFAGSGFDGMIDLAYSKYAYLLPDGSVQFAETQGTEGSRGVVPAQKAPTPLRGQRVSFGADHVSTSRHYSRGFLTGVAEKVCEYWGESMPEIKESYDGTCYVERSTRRVGNGYDTLDQLVHRTAYKTSA